jgi:hypothetical protein
MFINATLPHVLLFFVDDLGYGDMGFTGSPSAVTPTLDKLASDGRVLTNWYSGYPVCSASRCSTHMCCLSPRPGTVPCVVSVQNTGRAHSLVSTPAVPIRL